MRLWLEKNTLKFKKSVLTMGSTIVSREKHYSVDVIGVVLEGITFQCISAEYAQQLVGLTGNPVNSKQTILNWMKWFSIYHPAELLEKAGVKGSGYFQEDEGFQKEPCLSTYLVVIVDPDSQAVWHIDYVDHVNKETLYESFEDFLSNISFNVKGITKDKWKPSTNALKDLFYQRKPSIDSFCNCNICRSKLICEKHLTCSPGNPDVIWGVPC